MTPNDSGIQCRRSHGEEESIPTFERAGRQRKGRFAAGCHAARRSTQFPLDGNERNEEDLWF